MHTQTFIKAKNAALEAHGYSLKLSDASLGDNDPVIAVALINTLKC